ncbi:hypothetical protein EJ02DRAFT_3392 [Clathrospora elynae]|uniref:Secreted protein n=1 Tax=Clathrospora elynae TaxID=706981 RepID=A0A6A5T7B6_9PLEO|nr:hypothetical protein EJ02DRAFT_3392 [Clathrospora elynae]
MIIGRMLLAVPLLMLQARRSGPPSTMMAFVYLHPPHGHFFSSAFAFLPRHLSGQPNASIFLKNAEMKDGPKAAAKYASCIASLVLHMMRSTGVER